MTRRSAALLAAVTALAATAAGAQSSTAVSAPLIGRHRALAAAAGGMGMPSGARVAELTTMAELHRTGVWGAGEPQSTDDRFPVWAVLATYPPGAGWIPCNAEGCRARWSLRSMLTLVDARTAAVIGFVQSPDPVLPGYTALTELDR